MTYLGGTTTLIYHLSIHKEKYDEFNKEKAAEEQKKKDSKGC